MVCVVGVGIGGPMVWISLIIGYVLIGNVAAILMSLYQPLDEEEVIIAVLGWPITIFVVLVVSIGAILTAPYQIFLWRKR